VAGPAWRLTRERLELLGPEVAEAARRIGAQLPAAQPTGLAMQPLPGHWAFFGAFAQWCPQRSRFYWADVLAPALLESDGETTRELAMLDAPIAGLLFHGDEFVLPREQGALRLSADGAAVGEEPWPHGRTLAACNGPDDRFWVAMETAGGCAVGSVGRQGGRCDGSSPSGCRASCGMRQKDACMRPRPIPVPSLSFAPRAMQCAGL